MVPKYRFFLQSYKSGQIIFTNQKVINPNEFSNVKHIFCFDETLPQNSEEQIGIIKYTKFNDSTYLSSYANKYHNNPVAQALRFNYAFVNFKNINYWPHMYYIQACMALEGSKLNVQISKEILKQLYNNIAIEDCVRLFQQKVMNIGMLSIFQVKPCNTISSLDNFDLSFISQDKKVEAVDYSARKLLYISNGISYSQQINQQMYQRPERVIGEIYPL